LEREVPDDKSVDFDKLFEGLAGNRVVIDSDVGITLSGKRALFPLRWMHNGALSGSICGATLDASGSYRYDGSAIQVLKGGGTLLLKGFDASKLEDGDAILIDELSKRISDQIYL
jgi:hypothetical protein